MTAATRSNAKATSQRAGANIDAAAKHDPKRVYNAVLSCVEAAKEFTAPGIKALMMLRYPGDKESGSICSAERMRGVIAELERAGIVQVIDDSGKHAVYRWVRPVVEVEVEVKRVQANLF